jgi:tetratricopeptide (TPR) repeat protein
MRNRILCSVCLLSLAWLSRAEAKSGAKTPTNDRSEGEATARPEEQAKAAKKACAAGDFRKGVDILAELYVDTNQTTFIYNQGRCYEQAGKFSEAILRFREYLLKTKDISAEDKADTEAHIANCSRFQVEQQAKMAPPLAAPPQSGPEPIPSPQTLDVVAPTAPEPRSSILPTTGIVVGSVGLATLATAVILNLKANQIIDDAKGHPTASQNSSQKSYETAAWACYGVGGAALATGIVLYLVGRHNNSHTNPAVSMSPVLLPGGAALAARGQF